MHVSSHEFVASECPHNRSLSERIAAASELPAGDQDAGFRMIPLTSPVVRVKR